ncbi:MAG: hypothetical protein CVU44_09280 [Chloroflexi bacterium HGW-Chloroflexi-6]|nr:MAG: hypothetical protein CVU44_09280 [Chloroflexi bacterium HGW-Chloroflexi-6]
MGDWQFCELYSISFEDKKMMTKKSRITSISSCLRSLLFATVLALLAFGAIHPSPAVAQSARKQVLFINSYHPGYKFSDDITRALSETFAEQGNIDLRIEYLDTKRVDNAQYLDQVKKLYQTKYKDARLDLILSSDDAALNFLFKNADSLFPDVPVVFVGANFFDNSRLAGYERFTGVSEEADISGTLDVALSIHPNVRKVVVVNDTTTTGKIVHEILEDVIPQYPQITFELLEDVTIQEVQSRTGSLTSDTLVLLTIFSRDKAGTFFEYDQYTTLVAQSSAVPVYGTWDFSLGYGIVGGKLTSGYTEGQRAAKMAIRILNGESPRTIPVEKQTQSQYMFDYNTLEKWNINISRLPEGSLVIDRPISFYEQNTGLIWTIIIGFVLMLFVIAFLLVNNNQRRIAQEQLVLSNKELQDTQISLEQRVADRTKALATSSDVSRRLSTILDKPTLAREVVEQVQSAFNYYHAHIYFFDDDNENLVMAGGTGEAGAAMLASGHRIPRGRGLVGRAAETNAPVLVADVSQSIGWLPNPLLPETLSEAAVPISMGNKVLGVLDVQHNVVNGLDENDIALLQSLSGQVAISLQNAISFEQSRSKAELEALVNVIGQKIQRTASMEEALQTAIREVGLALGATSVRASIGLDTNPADQANQN